MFYPSHGALKHSLHFQFRFSHVFSWSLTFLFSCENKKEKKQSWLKISGLIVRPFVINFFRGYQIFQIFFVMHQEGELSYHD